MSSGAIIDRLATTPINWGFTAGERWGANLPTDRILREMRDLGFRATELGTGDFLPADPVRTRALLDANEQVAIAGMYAFVGHHAADLPAAVSAARTRAAHLRAVGADVMITLPTRGDLAVGEQPSTGEWAQLLDTLRAIEDAVGELGVRCALHPHVGSMVETGDDMERVLDAPDIGWCLDTAHIACGGLDVLELLRHPPTINHVHLKDVRLELGSAMIERRVSFDDAIARELFVPLGKGDLPMAEIVELLARRDDPWWVLEQDRSPHPSAAGTTPIDDARTSRAFVADLLASR